MIHDGNNIDENRVLINEENHFSMLLNNVYLSYFNAVHYVYSDAESFTYYTKDLLNMSSATLKNEFEYITEKLINVFGPDAMSQTTFNMEEIKDNKWTGRLWRIGDTIVELNFKQNIYLALYPLEYFKNSIIEGKNELE